MADDTPYSADDLPPQMETITELRGRCVTLDADGNVPPGERLFDVRQAPNPFRDIRAGGPS